MVEKNNNNILPVLPLRDIVVFPRMIVPLFVGREKSVKALYDVMNKDKQIMLVSQTINRAGVNTVAGQGKQSITVAEVDEYEWRVKILADWMTRYGVATQNTKKNNSP